MTAPTEADNAKAREIVNGWNVTMPDDIRDWYESDIAAALRGARREGIEEAARFMETHRYAHYTEPPAHRVDPDDDLDSVRRTYAAAIRALKEPTI